MRKLNFIILIFILSCGKTKHELPKDSELASAWADMTNYITRYTPANTPTFASRCFGYIGLTMYESIVDGYPEFQSIADSLNGLHEKPKPAVGIKYSWPLVMNAAEAEIIRNIYIQTSDDNKRKIDSLEQHFVELYEANHFDKVVIDSSSAYGKRIASWIFEWSKNDGGHRGYLKNFDKTLVFEQKPGGWRPPLYAQSFSHYPLHPHWGENRTFLPVNANLNDPKFIVFDSTPGSAYYDQFLQVYEQEKKLTDSEKQTAIWWSDDPDETFTPPGHSYYMATIAIRSNNPNLIHCAMTYARVGIAVSDAYRNCWKWKYHFFSERPNTFIVKYIDQRWHSFWPDPPFPAFPSGHAIQGSAAATVLEDIFGKDFVFVDSAHAGRNRDVLRNTDFVPRTFNSFWEAAVQCARSRFLGGIHTPQDNQTGLEQGKIIGENVNRLHWKK